MSDSRAAARCYFNLNSQKASPFKRRGFFMAAARPTKNEELRTKNSRAAAPNFNCRHRRPSLIRNPSSLISPEGYGGRNL